LAAACGSAASDHPAAAAGDSTAAEYLPGILATHYATTAKYLAGVFTSPAANYLAHSAAAAYRLASSAASHELPAGVINTAGLGGRTQAHRKGHQRGCDKKFNFIVIHDYFS
jgi:hypothetical protein